MTRIILLLSVLMFASAFGTNPASAQSHAKGMIGLASKDASNGQGAIVGIVTPGGPADKAGIEVGDTITAVNGTPIQNASAMTQIVASLAPGQTAHLTLLRARPNGTDSQHLNLAVVIGSTNAATFPNAQGVSNGATAPVSSPKSAGPAQPLAVSSYTSFSDPLEQAFTIQVPSGWHTVGGLARRAALQVNPFVRSLSPDKRTYLIIGEPTLPGYVPPSPMRNQLGYREGKMFDSGLGGLSMVLHSMNGQEFARVYGQSALEGLCTDLHYSGGRERSDMAHNADKLVPTVVPSISTGGEARFTCMHDKQPMEARIEAVTRTTRDNVMWNVIFLKGFIAPRNEADKAEEILTHVGASLKFNPAWLQKQSALDAQAAAEINRNMQNYFRQERTVINNLNASDQNFSSMDEIVSGYSDYRDPSTGNTYKLSNVNPYKWTDDSTGRILSTPTNAPPAWGSYRPLPHA